VTGEEELFRFRLLRREEDGTREREESDAERTVG
jgi:hypothetical protein